MKRRQVKIGDTVQIQLDGERRRAFMIGERLWTVRWMNVPGSLLVLSDGPVLFGGRLVKN